MSYTDKIARRARGLEPEETLLAATKAMANDEVAHTILSAASAVATGTFGMHGRRPEDGETSRAAADAGIRATSQMILGLTDRRLIAWRMSGLLARPKEVLGSIPLDRLTGARIGQDELFGFRVPAVVFEIRDSEPLQLGVPRVQARNAEHLVAALSERLGS